MKRHNNAPEWTLERSLALINLCGGATQRDRYAAARILPALADIKEVGAGLDDRSHHHLNAEDIRCDPSR